jgi:hypothetical protein
MTTFNVPLIVDWQGTIQRNDEIQPPTDPILTLKLKTQDGSHYFLPLSERGISRLWEAISEWRQARDFLSQSKSPAPDKLQ